MSLVLSKLPHERGMLVPLCLEHVALASSFAGLQDLCSPGNAASLLTPSAAVVDVRIWEGLRGHPALCESWCQRFWKLNEGLSPVQPVWCPLLRAWHTSDWTLTANSQPTVSESGTGHTSGSGNSVPARLFFGCDHRIFSAAWISPVFAFFGWGWGLGLVLCLFFRCYKIHPKNCLLD